MFYAKFGNRWLLIPDQKPRLDDAVRVVLCPTVLCAPNQETQEAHPKARGCFLQLSNEAPHIAPMTQLLQFTSFEGDTFVWQKTKGLLRPALLAPLPSHVQSMNLFALFCLAKTEGVLGKDLPQHLKEFALACIKNLTSLRIPVEERKQPSFVR